MASLPSVDGGVVNESMRGYYDRRAPEYDDWWLDSGSFAGRERSGWSAEVAHLIQVIARLPAVRVLDVACGTGFLTRHLRGDVVGLDQSSEMVRASTARLPAARIIRGDAVPLPFDDGEFDRVFTSHFYGHLLPDERERFVGEARRVGRELVVVDAAKRPDIPEEGWQERRLDDGSRHLVYKRYFTGAALARELGGGSVLFDGRWFVVVAA